MAARVDGEMLFQQISVGSCVPPHMLARGEYWRMATATALDWTLERMFSAYQALLREYYTDLIKYQLHFSADAGNRLPDPEKWQIDMDFPVLTRQPAKEALEALVHGGWLIRLGEETITYEANLRRKRGSSLAKSIWGALDARIEEQKRLREQASREDTEEGSTPEPQE